MLNWLEQKLVPGGSLSPNQISPTFATHIREKSSYLASVDEDPNYPVQDWCVDPLHTLGDKKPGKDGNIVAGAGIRRVNHKHGVSLLSPYELMQRQAEMTSGEKVKVVFSFHNHCGKVFIDGAVTPTQQARVADSAWKKWQADYKRLSPADRKKVVLDKREGLRGSAPTILYQRDGHIQIANSRDYLDSVIDKYPLTAEVFERLTDNQKQRLASRGITIEHMSSR